jgi:transposase
MSTQDIVVVTDYHAKNIEFRVYDAATGEERTFNRPTEAATIEAALEEAWSVTSGRGGRVVWIMESTTGWARVKKLLGDRAQFLLANVLQIPQPPKAHRRKTDKLDTGRILREYLHGELPQAHQPDEQWRMARRLVAMREDLVRRQTVLKNQIKAYFAHETWDDRTFWSESGMTRLKGLIEHLAESDRFVLDMKVQELEDLPPRLEKVEQRLLELYRRWPDAQRLDAIRGIAPVSAVSVVARIGPIKRFTDAEQLIAYAGLAPGIRGSDTKSVHLSIGGGGTDRALRNYIIEATVWAREIPRYRKTYERTMARRGRKIARIVVARLLLRSIHKMLRDGVPFNAAA